MNDQQQLAHIIRAAVRDAEKCAIAEYGSNWKFNDGQIILFMLWEPEQVAMRIEAGIE